MKKLVLKSLVLAFIAISTLSFTACEKQGTTDELASGELKEINIEGECLNSLVYMREEEKLAHDVYVNMFELWSLPIFNNISKSETFHTNAIKGLLEYYHIEDPTLPGIGEFSNPDLQILYNGLLEIGSVSLVEGLVVGATIEEVDIMDLDVAIANCTEDTVITVYNRLSNASFNHLRAFVRQLGYQGIEYTPQFISQERYDEIINGTHNTGGGGCDSTIVVTLSPEEEAGLLFMREEEKLAHDVYVYLFNMWEVPVFDFISRSESFHTNRILFLINKYGLEDPALPTVGEFTNTELQTLYNQLIATGSESLISALIVGATVEEVDILDLFERMEQTENPIITRVYSSLEKGSEAHLRAFVRQLSFNGHEYIPQFLSQEEFDRIMGN
ncbi:MAG: DUF2202 domain-containing protein [Bacteroidales bacterium]|nr:DUF2202 domain-containing protein [Bacteroidales bacterium]